MNGLPRQGERTLNESGSSRAPGPGRHALAVAQLLVLLSGSAAGEPLLRELLTVATGRPDHEHVLVRRCSRCGGPHGRPVAEGTALHVSNSRSGGIGAAAATVAGAVGIDLQEQAATTFAGFAEVALAPGERAAGPAQRARTWARKEAVLKALGLGLTVDPRDLVLTGPDEAPALLAGPCSPERLHLFDVPAPPGWAGAAAVLAAARPELRVLSPRAGVAGEAGRAGPTSR